MMQSDVQSTFGPEVRVIVARPVAVNLRILAVSLYQQLSSLKFSLHQLETIVTDQKKVEEILKAPIVLMGTGMVMVPLNAMSQMIEIAKQLTLVGVKQSKPGRLKKDERNKNTFIDLTEFAKFNPLRSDIEAGICPIPIFEISPDKIEKISSGVNLDDVRAILDEFDIYKYFYPSPDQLALGLAHRGANSTQLMEGLTAPPRIGHPYSSAEMVGKDTKLEKILNTLQEAGMIAEGEFGYNVTPKGEEVRVKVKFRPREGVVSKVLGRLQVKASILNIAKLKFGK